MTGTPAHHIAQRLQSLGIGVIAASSGWSLAVSREPAAPVTAVTVYDTGGGPIDTDDQDMESPTFQVRVRSADYVAAYEKQVEIREAMIRAAFMAGGRRYFSVAATSGILALGRDDNDRFLLTQNFQALCEAA